MSPNLQRPRGDAHRPSALSNSRVPVVAKKGCPHAKKTHEIADSIHRLPTCVPDAAPRAEVAHGALGCMVSLLRLADAYDSMVKQG